MKEIYKKTYTISFIAGIALLLWTGIYTFFFYESFIEDGETLGVLGILALCSIGAGFHYKSAYRKLMGKIVEQRSLSFDMDNHNELILQRVPSPLIKIYNVDANGNPLFQIEPMKRRLSSWMTFFEIFGKGLFIPVLYVISDLEGRNLATFSIRGSFKRGSLALYRPTGDLIGTFVQHHAKSILKNRGVLYHADGTVWRELRATSAAGDITVKDNDGNMTATYRFGLFPYATNPAFQATANHQHIRFGSQVSAEEKFVYAMIFFYWLAE